MSWEKQLRVASVGFRAMRQKFDVVVVFLWKIDVDVVWGQ